MTLEGYFFANRKTHWFALGVSFLSGCIFSPYFLGLLSVDSASSLVIIYGIVSVIMLVILGWLVVPIYLREKISSIPEYIEKRFNQTCKLFLSLLYIFYNIFFRLVIIITIGNILISRITNADPYSSILFFLIVAGIYIVIGGLNAEIYINIVQMIFIIFGAGAFIVWMFNQHSFTNFNFSEIISSSFSITSENSEFTLPGLIIGLPIIGFWFWCADQFMVQKVLSVRNIFSAKKAAYTSIFMQLIPVIVFILPGILLLNLSHGTNVKEILFAGTVLPEVIRMGIILAIAGILMSSFASLFNSTSYLITFDFYRNFNPGAMDKKLVLIGRLTTILLLMVSILLIPLSQSISLAVCFKLFYTFSYFAAMTAAILIVGLLNKKINSLSVIITLSIETLIILFKTSLVIFFNDYLIPADFASWFLNLKFLEFTIFVFLSTILSLFILNYLTLAQHSTVSIYKILKKVPVKLSLKKNLHRTIFFILLILIVLIVWGVIFS